MLSVLIQGLGFVGSAMSIAVASRVDSKGDPLFSAIGIDLPTKEGHKRINAINVGEFPFKTNDQKLSRELKKAVGRGNLKATTDKDVYSEATIVLVSINCDLIKKNGKEIIALDHFTDSIRAISENIYEDTLVIIESTVPPGTCDRLNTYFMPEFLTEKNYIEDFKKSLQWIVGCPYNTNPIINDKHIQNIQTVFSCAHKHNCICYDSLVIVSSKEAELCKYVRNSFLALKVSFCNEIYSYCHKDNINYQNIQKLLC